MKTVTNGIIAIDATTSLSSPPSLIPRLLRNRICMNRHALDTALCPLIVWLALRVNGQLLYPVQHIIAIDESAKDGMLAVEVGKGSVGEEELGKGGVRR